MACIDPDGTLTITAKFLLKALAESPLPPEEIAKRLPQRLRRVGVTESVFRARGGTSAAPGPTRSGGRNRA